MVLLSVAVWQKTSSKHDDGVHSVAIVALIKSTHKNKSSKSSSGEILDCSFIFCSIYLLSICLSALFPLATFLINVISVYSQSHSLPDLVSLRQQVFYQNDRAGEIEFSVTDISVSMRQLRFTKPATQSTVGYAWPAYFHPHGQSTHRLTRARG